VTIVDAFELSPEFVDVLLLSGFHLLEDLLLGVKLTVKVLSLGKRLINLELEFPILLG
jgi:hypothetical protein